MDRSANMIQSVTILRHRGGLVKNLKRREAAFKILKSLMLYGIVQQRKGLYER